MYSQLLNTVIFQYHDCSVTLFQATENATQTAIKSVHLFGQPYNGITLEEIPEKTAKQGSVVSMIWLTSK